MGDVGRLRADEAVQKQELGLGHSFGGSALADRVGRELLVRMPGVLDQPGRSGLEILSPVVSGSSTLKSRSPPGSAVWSSGGWHRRAASLSEQSWPSTSRVPLTWYPTVFGGRAREMGGAFREAFSGGGRCARVVGIGDAVSGASLGRRNPQTSRAGPALATITGPAPWASASAAALSGAAGGQRSSAWHDASGPRGAGQRPRRLSSREALALGEGGESDRPCAAEPVGVGDLRLRGRSRVGLRLWSTAVGSEQVTPAGLCLTLITQEEANPSNDLDTGLYGHIRASLTASYGPETAHLFHYTHAPFSHRTPTPSPVAGNTKLSRSVLEPATLGQAPLLTLPPRETPKASIRSILRVLPGGGSSSPPCSPTDATRLDIPTRERAFAVLVWPVSAPSRSRTFHAPYVFESEAFARASDMSFQTDTPTFDPPAHPPTTEDSLDVDLALLLAPDPGFSSSKAASNRAKQSLPKTVLGSDASQVTAYATPMAPEPRVLEIPHNIAERTFCAPQPRPAGQVRLSNHQTWNLVRLASMALCIYFGIFVVCVKSLTPKIAAYLAEGEPRIIECSRELRFTASTAGLWMCWMFSASFTVRRMFRVYWGQEPRDPDLDYEWKGNQLMAGLISTGSAVLLVDAVIRLEVYSMNSNVIGFPEATREA
ncbi:hypothetical protein JHW43_007314 [Diplocarpon mali]|nr:hypothetical protein JHW43_007314 [Diplocarpon mali]